MKRSDIVFALGLALVVGFSAFRIGYRVAWSRATSEERKQIGWNGSHLEIDDAFRRWAVKNGSTVQQALKDRYARTMFFPNKTCIELVIVPPGVGGTPIYCYKPGTILLTEEYSASE